MSADGAAADLSAVKLALLAQELRGRADVVDTLAAEPIAILGMGCRFPGAASSPEELWELLRDRGDGVRETPPDRWDASALYDPDPAAAGKMNTRWGGFLDRVDEFDAAYFGISRREAEHMDPQQRVLLQVAVEALERAGQPAERLSGSATGVFVAASMSDYSARQYERLDAIDAYALTGNVHCILANRLSFLLDLRGPSLAVDTACSSSLVAVHLACQSLRNRDSDLALAAGVNLVLVPGPTMAMAKWGLMAADGRCKTFDARADGFVRGEGCGVVVLKRLADAIADGDPVAAVIRASAVNQDGRSTTMSAPNGLAQREVIRAALRAGHVRPEQITCVEAHGTGTVLGDPIEVEALAEVLGPPSDGAPSVALTAVKPNLGHLEAAAGVAGLIKLVLCLQHEEIPPVAHFTTLNPHLSLEGTRLEIPTTTRPWVRASGRRLAGVSSFGFGGTNAHVIVEEAPLLPVASGGDGPFALLVSARTAAALADAAVRLADHVDRVAPADLGHVAFTTAVRRTHHDERLAVVGASGAELVERLRAASRGEPLAGTVSGRREPGQRPRVAFVCSGQGPQWWGMGRELLATSAAFRDVVEACDARLRPLVGWSLLDELNRDEGTTRLGDTEIAQPAIFALQVGLAAVWQAWGVRADAIVGHSVGEVAAAHLAGALTLDDAIRVIAHRGRFMQAATGNGTMASVELADHEVEGFLGGLTDRVGIAARNGPRATVISGDVDAMRGVTEAMTAAGVVVKPLPVDYAFHSHQMAPHADALAVALTGLEPARHQTRFISTVTGMAMEGTELGAAYWARNVREPVRFGPAIGTLLDTGCDVFVELSAHPVLGGAINDVAAERSTPARSVASLRRGRGDVATLLEAAGRLWTIGVPVDWARVWPGRRRVEPLPTYPWQQQRFWYDAPAGAVAPGLPAEVDRPLLGRRVRSAAITGTVYEVELSPSAPAFLADHRIGGLVLVPATAFVELALAMYQEATGRAGRLHDVELLAALALDEGTATTVQIHFEGEPDAMTFAISGLDGEAWTTHIRGRVSPTSDDRPAADPGSAVETIRERAARHAMGAELYARFAAGDVDFGPAFRGLEEVWVGDGEAIGRVVVPPSVAPDAGRYLFHPALLDAILHPLQLLLPDDGAIYLPVAIADLDVHCAAAGGLWTHVRLARGAAGSVSADVTAFDDDGAVVAEVRGLHVARTSRATLARLLGRADDDRAGDLLFEMAWTSVPLSPADGAPRGACLIVGDAGGLGQALAEALAAAGRASALVGGSEYPSRAELTAQRDAIGATDVVVLGGIDLHAAGPGCDVVAELEPALRAALAAAQAVTGSASRLWLVTRGAHGVRGSTVLPEQASLSGFGAGVAAERPELACTRLDLDPAADLDDAAAVLAATLGAPDDEEIVAWRDGERLAGRLIPFAGGASPATSDGPVRLVASEPGVLDGLRLEPLARRAPGPGEVEIEVHATGLNFRDVLVALDLYPEAVSVLGEECAGEVVQVGPGVDALRAGDLVLAMGSGAFASYLTTPADLAMLLPAGIDIDDAATIPIAFLTAQYALVELAELRQGERVLIHAGAGGVGMAAIQLAQRLGAEVLATAGSPAKRALLHDLGVRHVFDSRSLGFADSVLAATGGKGVEVVLNSLAGDWIPRSLDVTAPGGRFLEIGRRDAWEPERVAAYRPDIAYHVVFLGDLSLHDPPAIQVMLQGLRPSFEAGELRPLPRTTFPIERAVDAFRFMAQARHTGKIVVRHGRQGTSIRDDGTYLITGGLGGIGLALGRHLVDRGARHLALVGRSAPDSVASDAVAALADLGASVRTFQVDVASPGEVRSLLDDIAATMPRLVGVVHAAGVNEDAVLDELAWCQFEAVLKPKWAGAANLDVMTAGLGLDMFVLCSSASAVVGAPGQANYAAANATLDALAQARRARGEHGLSIGWGPWDRVGMTARLDDADRARIERRGFRSLTPARALAAFDRALAAGPAHLVVADLDRERLERRSLLADLAGRREVAEAPSHDVLAEWAELPPGLRSQAITAFVVEQARKILGLGVDAPMPLRQPFQEMGLDSLMAVDLRNAIGRALGQPQPASLLFDHPTAEALAQHLTGLVAGTSAVVADQTALAAGTTRPSPTLDPTDLDELTEAEAEALLLAELGDTGVAS